MKSNFFLNALLWIGMLSSLPAVHSTASAREVAAAGRSAWFCVSSIPEGLENPVMIRTSRGTSELVLSRRSSSQPVPVPPDGEIALIREIVNPDKPSEKIYRTLARAVLPERSRQVLVMLVPLPEPKPDGTIFHASVHDLGNFKGGDYMFLNLTKLNVAAQMGDQRVQVRPGRNAISSDAKVTGPTSVAISYHFQDPQTSEWRLISASTVARMPTRREICIFSWDEKFNRINYHGITFPVDR